MGTEVLWENRGRNEHDVLPADAGEDWGVEKPAFDPGDTLRPCVHHARHVRLLLLDPWHGEGGHDRNGRGAACRRLTRGIVGCPGAAPSVILDA